MNCFVALLSATAQAIYLSEIASAQYDCELAQLLADEYKAAPAPFNAAQTAA